MKQNGIKSLAVGRVKIQLQPRYKTPKAPVTGEIKVDRPLQASEEEQKKIEEETLYWSAGA